MNDYIKSNYNLIEEYEKNNYQEMLMGTEIDNTEKVIVLNKLNKEIFNDPDLSSTLESSLHNFLYVSQDSKNINLVTRYNQGETLTNYLSNNNLSSESKIQIAKLYIDKIAKYNSLSNNFKNILVNKNQIIINDKGLFINELILFSTIEEIPFSEISKSVGIVLNKLMEKDEFIESLLSGSSIFNSLSDIQSIFNTRYTISDDFVPIDNKVDENTIIAGSISEEISILNSEELKTDKTETKNKEKNDVPLDLENEDEIELSSLEFIDQSEDKSSTKDEKKSRNKYLIPFIIILSLLSLAFIIPKLLSNNTSLFSSKNEESFKTSFTKIKKGNNYKFEAKTDKDSNFKYEWTLSKDDQKMATFDKKIFDISFKEEGTYLISLRIQDKDGNWSESYSEEIYFSNEPVDSLDNDESSTNNNKEDAYFDNSAIKFNTDNITADYENKKSGSKSIKLDFTDGKSLAKFTLNREISTDSVTFSFYIKSSTRNPISLNYKGFSGNTEIFEKNQHFIPKLENNWEMNSFSVNSTGVDKFEVTVESADTIIWIDNIEIKPFK